MTNWYNYFVHNKNSRLTKGHIKSSELVNKILEHNGNEAYACYFDLDYDSLKEEFDTGKFNKKGKSIYEYHAQGSECPLPSNGITFTSYEGTCKPAFNCVAFDFDGTSDDDALSDVRRFVTFLGIDDAVVFFSGSKGFHVLIHFDYFNLSAGPDLVLQLKDLAKYLKEHFPTLDAGIYNYNRKFRVPFTKHDKSGLYKTVFDVDDFVNDDNELMSMDDFRKQSTMRTVGNFLPPTKVRIHNDQLTKAIEESKRASYEIEKHRAGTMDKPSPFEAYDNKLCIKKMLTSRCEGQINNTRMRIVNDFYRTGMTYENAEIELAKWSDACGSDTSKDSETLDDIYNGRKVYNFGCQDELKTQYCSAKCSIWSKLTPEKRPVVIDAPKSAAMESEQAKRIPQKQIAVDLLRGDFRCLYDVERDEYHGGNIIRQENDLFIFEDDYWQLIDVASTDKIKRRINVYLEGKASMSQIDNIFKMFLVYVPVVPVGVDMFMPKSNMVNFLNGTLHVLRDKEGKLYSEFRNGHCKTDYITSKHSLKYQKSVGMVIPDKFKGVLDDLFKDSPDKEDKVKTMAMMYGAALMPMFPMMFYFYGKAKTGKSTMILILKQLLDDKNLCSVQPKHFSGFNLETMVGKLVNYVTDVDVRTPINDDVVKQVLDKTPMTIRRKNRTDIRACLPALHIFAGNELLKSFEASTAMERRWIIIEFLNEINDKDSNFASADDFARYIFSQDPEGILQFALWGLELLIANNGKFIQFDSSRKSMKEWQNREDIVEQFIDDVTTDGVILEGKKHHWDKNKDGRVLRSYTWNLFNVWQQDSLTPRDCIKKKDFFVRLEGKNFRVYKRNGEQCVVGFQERHVSNVDNSDALNGI